MRMRMTRMKSRIMMVATVNEEGSSCSKLAANFSQLDFASILHCTACAAINNAPIILLEFSFPFVPIFYMHRT